MDFRLTPGHSGAAARLLVVGALATALFGCNYGLRGGGFPEHIHTIYVESFENETPQFEIGQELFRRLLDKVPSSLGIRQGSRDNADAILSGTIVGYDDVAQNYTAGRNGSTATVLAHEVRISVNARILDTKNNVVLWEERVTGKGTYRPDSESELVGRNQAIEGIVQAVIDGALSQW